MPNQFATMNLVFHALTSPTRRSILEQLCRGPASTGQLAQPFKMALPSLMEHLAVLKKSGLIRSRKAGRVRTYELSPQPLQHAEQWLAAQRSHWEQRLNQLDQYLKDMKEQP
ncbi:MAG: helix-turn-helix transcriptional regulator [Phycisphaeraceae bacterium]|nr:helix-turn-helix transcriptional regulator [Phycisphaeraceae bacterium]